jgi:phage shock protein E
MRMCLALLLTAILTGPALASEAPLWIDVRSADEYADGHLDGAVNIPYDEIATRISELTRDKKRAIRLYCGVGVRAQVAKFALEAQGFEQVTNEGGYSALRAVAGQQQPACGVSC